jgi:hypothetical protein
MNPALLAPLFLVPALTAGQDGPSTIRTETEMRAYHLYALAMVTDWPEEAFSDPHTPFLIGILGTEAIGPAFTALQTRTAKGRRIKVLQSMNLEDLAQCHLLYIPPSEDQDLIPILRALRGRPILTTGEHESHTQLGGIVRLILAEGSLKMEVNLRAAREARLTFRSQFLKMVTRVVY